MRRGASRRAASRTRVCTTGWRWRWPYAAKGSRTSRICNKSFNPLLLRPRPLTRGRQQPFRPLFPGGTGGLFPCSGHPTKGVRQVGRSPDRASGGLRPCKTAKNPGFFAENPPGGSESPNFASRNPNKHQPMTQPYRLLAALLLFALPTACGSDGGDETP